MTGSATAMGVVLLAAAVPRLIFMLIGGVAADRLPRRLIVLWSDGGRGIIILIIAVLGGMHVLQFWQLVAQSLLFGVVDGFFNPAINAITPDLVDKENLVSANSLSSLSQTLTQLFGPALGATLVALTSTTGAFAADALSFFLSVTLLLLVRIPQRVLISPMEVDPSDETGLDRDKERKGQGLKSFIADISEGLVYVKSSRWIWVTILVASLGNIGFVATLGVAMPKLVHDVYGQGVWLLGTINSASAVGGIIGLIVVAQATRLKRRGLLAYLSLLVSCVGITIFGLPFPQPAAPIIAPIASALVGFGLACFNTIWFTVLQEMIPSNKLGRVISIDSLGSFAMIPIADALGGIATDHFGPALIFLVAGIANFIFNGSALLVREVRKLE